MRRIGQFLMATAVACALGPVVAVYLLLHPEESFERCRDAPYDGTPGASTGRH